MIEWTCHVCGAGGDGDFPERHGSCPVSGAVVRGSVRGEPSPVRPINREAIVHAVQFIRAVVYGRPTSREEVEMELGSVLAGRLKVIPGGKA